MDPILDKPDVLTIDERWAGGPMRPEAPMPTPQPYYGNDPVKVLIADDGDYTWYAGVVRHLERNPEDISHPWRVSIRVFALDHEGPCPKCHGSGGWEQYDGSVVLCGKCAGDGVLQLAGITRVACNDDGLGPAVKPYSEPDDEAM